MKHTVLHIAQEEFEETIGHLPVEEQLHHIAMEAGVFNDLTRRLTTFLPSVRKEISDRLTGLVNGFKADNLGIENLTRQEKKVLIRAKDLNYGTFGERLIAVPEGFIGNFAEYLDALIGIVSNLPKLNRELIDNYISALSVFISTTDGNLPMRDYAHIYKEARTQRDNMSKDVSRFFDKTDNTRIQARRVITRMGDVEVIIKRTHQLSEIIKHMDLNDLKDKVDKIVTLLDILMDKISKEEIKVTSSTVMALSEGAFEISKYVESLSVLYYDVQVVLNKIGDFYDTILKE